MTLTLNKQNNKHWTPPDIYMNVEGYLEKIRNETIQAKQPCTST